MADDLEQIAREDLEGQPTLEQVLEQTITAASERMHTCAPAVATSVSASAGTCAAQQAVTRTGEDPEPVVPEVKVLQLRTSKGRITLPFGSKDAVLVVHANRSLDEWNGTDGTQVVEARDPRAHDPTDAVALPMAPGSFDGSNIVIVCDSLVLIGGDAAAAIEAVVKGTTLKANIIALGPPSSSVPPGGGPDAPLLTWCAALYAALGSSLPLSTKVKVA